MKGDNRMSHAFSRGLVSALAAVPFLIACGGNSGTPGAISSAQCSGPSCPTQGPPPSAPSANALCPATADIVKSTYLGGAGSGEVVSLNIDATAMTYTLTWLQSPIPVAAGVVQPTREGLSITGAVSHPPAGFLPTAEQTRCAFILSPGTGTIPTHSPSTTFDGTQYTSPINPQNPPMILVGQGGVAGGGTPGAEIQYDGAPDPLDPLGPLVFPVPDRKFDFYPFIGFAETDSNLADLKGTYNVLAYHIRPSGNYGAIGLNAVETFDDAGHCSSTATKGCLTTEAPVLTAGSQPGTPWAPVPSTRYFSSQNVPQLLPPATLLGLITFENVSPGYMVIGKVNGALVPVVVRAGRADPANFAVDDESGIALLATANPVASGGIDGGYVGADSNFKYTATLIKGGTGSFINPSTQAAESAFGLQYGASTPGIVTATDAQSGASGVVVAAGGLYGALFQGTENGGITPSSGIAGQTTASVPYFGIGAQISK
jgi:hypothetical protein